MGILHLKMSMLIVALFAVLYAIVTVVMTALGVTSFALYVALACVIMFIQYLVGPKIVEMVMRLEYIERHQAPWLFGMVDELSARAKIPTPRIAISHVAIPNAFAFGRSIKDGRVCVTKGILKLLEKDELRAVLGHEISHLKNRDVLFITVLSVIPLILYRIAFHLLLFGGFSRRREGGGYTPLIGLAALVFYFLTNLIVLYGSRIREYFADRGSLDLGNSPSTLATALYKLVYGTAVIPKENLREAEGIKAFFLNDPSKARREIKELAQLDLDRNGTIDPYELDALKRSKISLTFIDKVMETLSTHPNMLKRIKHLSAYQRSR